MIHATCWRCGKTAEEKGEPIVSEHSVGYVDDGCGDVCLDVDESPAHQSCIDEATAAGREWRLDFERRMAAGEFEGEDDPFREAA